MITEKDVDRALSRFRGLIGPDANPDELLYFVHEGAPASKARARWSGKTRRHYTPDETRTAQEALAWRFRSAMGGREPFKGCIAVVAIFFRPNYQRIDVDNLMKLVMDAATQARVWVDDCYVTAQAAFVELDPFRPRTLVIFGPATSSLDRSFRFTCRRCGNPFNRAGTATFKNPPKFCSRECRYAAARQEAACAKCGTVFKRHRAQQRYCSRVCSRSSPLVRQNSGNQRPWPKCITCGGRVSRREYRQCANCAPKGRKIGSKNKAETPA